MFKQLKRKIIISIMVSVVLIFLIIIGVIYITTYKALYTNNQNLIQEFIDRSSIDSEFKSEKRQFGGERGKLDKNNVFYRVAFNSDSSVYQILNDIDQIISDEDLVNLARNIISEGNTEGNTSDFIYKVNKENDITYVTFMKNTIKGDSMDAVVENAFIFGGIILIVLFVLSIKVADKITKPLEENYKKQKQFISDAGHEFKTPISTISANSEILERQVGKNQWIENIKFENERMHTLVEQLLNLSRTENVAINMNDINLSRIILGGVLPFESIAFEKGYMIETDIEKDVHVLGDLAQLGQLISILTDNALSHAEGEGKINIQLKSEKNMKVIEVSNPGKEIPKEEREKIFERFYRMDESRSLEKSGHYGLGLSIAKSIVNNHKGKIYVKCKDGITTFIVKIPQN